MEGNAVGVCDAVQSLRHAPIVVEGLRVDFAGLNVYAWLLHGEHKAVLVYRTDEGDRTMDTVCDDQGLNDFEFLRIVREAALALCQEYPNQHDVLAMSRHQPDDFLRG